MTTRLPCRTCGDLIHPDTAAKNNDLCMPCKGGYRERIEEGKRQRERERAYEKSPERQHWLSLVERVHKSSAGFHGLSPDEQTYFALRCLIGEVFNGGFHQFFANHSGEYYGFAVNGLLDLEAMVSHQLLTKAKEVLFGDQAVPTDFSERNQSLRFIEENDFRHSRVIQQLEVLDKQFWPEPDSISDRCSRFAIARGLYSGDA
jgi:hypothetical protein